MPDWSPLLIPGLLVVGALVLPIARRFVSARYRFLILPILLTVTLMGIAVNLRGLPHSIVISTLALPLAGSQNLAITFHWTIDLLSLLPVSLAILGWLALALVKGGDESGASSELVWLAVLFPLVAATNLSTLLALLLLTDIVTLIYFAQHEAATTARRNFVTNQLGTLALVVAAILASADAFDLNADRIVFDDMAGLIALVGIGIRLNLFPFHFGLPFNFWLKTERPLWNLLLPAAVNLTILARLTPWLTNGIAYRSLLYVWILLVPVFAALQAWRDDEADTAVLWSWQTVLAVAFAIPLFVDGDARGALLAAFVVSAFALVLLELARRVDFSLRRIAVNKIFYAWGIATLASAPLTMAFFGRVRLLSDAWNLGALTFVLLSTLATAFALTPLAANWFALASNSVQRPTWREGIACGVAALFALATSFTPWSLLGILDSTLAATASATYATFLRSNQFAQIVGILFALLAPLALAFYLGQRWHSLRARWGVVWARVISPLMFTEIFALGARALEQLSNVGRMIYVLVEHYPLGWILFSAIGVALWLALGH